MSFYQRGAEKRRALQEFRLRDEDLLGTLSSSEQCTDDMSPKVHLEQEKRLRREIANSNERRRMQSINSGFQSLKTLIPHHEGEKLSKAAILQQTSEYITTLEQEKTRLLSQNAQLKRIINDIGRDSDVSSQGSPPPKRKKRDTESSDEGIGLSLGDTAEDPGIEELKREMIELRCQLDRERRLRMMLEEQTRTLETQLYPERLRQIATQVQAQMKYQEEKERYLEEKRIQDEKTVARLQEQSASPPSSKFISATASSMSRKNLETIVEAIRHLEGDSVLCDGDSKDIPHSEESEKDESSISSDIDVEDLKSESSSSDSPLSAQSLEAAAAGANISTTATATVHLQAHGNLIFSTEKYPIASHLLRHPFPHQFLPQRPGVIVQNLS